MPTDPNIALHIDTDVSGFTGPITETLIEAALHDERRALADAEAATSETDAAHLRRAQAVLRVVELLDGNQSEAARRIGIDQSRVNRLVQKARAAALADKQGHHFDDGPSSSDPADLELRDTPTTEGG